MECVRLVIRGRVQGVYFRESTREEAERLGVRGWVRNNPDGSVEAHAEGDAAAVQSLVRWCHAGPQRARVEEVHSEPAEAQGHAGFEVLR